MAELQFTIKSLLQGAGFTDAAAGLRGVDVASEGAATGLESLNAAAETVETTLNAFIGLQIIQFFREIVDATAKAETQQLQLKTRVDSTGASFEANAPKINMFLDGIQEITHVAKEDLLPAFEQLITRTHSVREAQELLTTTVGVARGANMGYVEAANLVAGVMNNNARAILQATKMLGLHKGAATDSVAIMKDLQATFQSMADKVSPATAVVGDMTNKWTDFKVELGEGVMPVLSLIGDVALRVANFALATIRGIFDALVIGVKTGEIAVLSLAALVSDRARDMRDAMVDSANKTTDDLNSAYGKMADSVWKFSAESADAGANIVAQNKRVYDELNEQQRQAIADGLAAASAGDQARYQTGLAALDKQAKAQKKALLDASADQLLTEQDKAALMESVDNQMLAKRAALKAQYDKAESDQTKNLLMSQVALTQAGTQDQLNARLNLLKATMAAEKQQVNDSILTEQQRAQALLVIDNNTKAARQKLYLDFYTQMSQTAIKAGNIIGDTLGQQLAGQQVSWRNSLSQILKMIINSAETAILANYMVGASQQVAQGGWWGVASGAALIAVGGAAASAVAGLVADPSSSPSAPSASASASSVASAPPTTSAAPAGTQGQGALSVNIYGDTINDPAYINSLARALSSAVNNKDVRLVATGINGQPNLQGSR